MLYIDLKHRVLRGEAGNAVVTVLAGTVCRWEAREEVDVPLIDGLAGRWDRGCRRGRGCAVPDVEVAVEVTFVIVMVSFWILTLEGLRAIVVVARGLLIDALLSCT